MAIIKNNSLIHQVSGSFNRQFIYKNYYDKTVLAIMPDMSKRVLSEKQKESNEFMRSATNFASYIYRTEEGKIKARIRLKVPPHKSLFHALIKEYLKEYKHLSLSELEKRIAVM